MKYFLFVKPLLTCAMGNVLKRLLEVVSYPIIGGLYVPFKVIVSVTAVVASIVGGVVYYILKGEWVNQKIFEAIYIDFPKIISDKIVEPYFRWLDPSWLKSEQTESKEYENEV